MRGLAICVMALSLAGCGALDRVTGALSSANPFASNEPTPNQPADRSLTPAGGNTQIKIDTTPNRYIWAAAQDVLNFLPVQSADQTTGQITTGFGTAPGSNRAYRAVITVRSFDHPLPPLALELYTRSGRASAAQHRAIEDAIFTRARQLRRADNDK